RARRPEAAAAPRGRRGVAAIMAVRTGLWQEGGSRRSIERGAVGRAVRVPAGLERRVLRVHGARRAGHIARDAREAGRVVGARSHLLATAAHGVRLAQTEVARRVVGIAQARIADRRRAALAALVARREAAIDRLVRRV